MTDEGGGTNCNKYLKENKPHTHFRLGKNTKWFEDGMVDWIWGFVDPNRNGGDTVWVRDNGKKCIFF